MIQNHVKYNNYSIYMNMVFFKKKSRLILIIFYVIYLGPQDWLEVFN